MQPHPLIGALEGYPEYIRLRDTLAGGLGGAAVFGLGEAHRAHIAAALSENLNRTVLIVTSNETSAMRMREDLSAYMDAAYHLPIRDIPLAGRGYAASLELASRRVDILSRLIGGQRMAVVVSAAALIQRMTPKKAMAEAIIRLKAGERREPRELMAALISMGYESVDLCEGKGQACLRGGYLDVYPVTAEYPVRIEFFDDEIDTMRLYDPLSQRSIENVKETVIPPAGEIVLTADARERGKRAMRRRERLSEEYEALSQGGLPQGVMTLLPLFYDEAYILDYLPPDAIVLVDEPSRVEESAKIAHAEHLEALSALIATQMAEPEQADLLGQPSRVIGMLDTPRTAMFFAFARTYGLIGYKALFRFETRPATVYAANTDMLAGDILLWRKNVMTVLIYAGEHAKRTEELLADSGVTVAVTERLKRPIVPGELLIVGESLSRGFEYPELKLVVVSENELYGGMQRRSYQGKKRRPQLVFSELSVGDLVVHELHGIGRFNGVETLTAAGVTRDYLNITYAGGEKLYIPTDQLDRVQKYIGAEDDNVKLSKLGSGEWQRTVSRTREGVKRLAFDLVKLYGERMNMKGFAFSKDTLWQRRLEEGFPYEETPDQLTCIDEIKRDMESGRVMDRLLCGDVGYGKTEVALRAAFKAAMDGKQVAILVPTTILAQQHYNTIASRFFEFPITVALLSRFKSQREGKEILDGLKGGSVDVVIGTHKLLSKGVSFKDLGLLIVDEEQRFGVGHKEQIKQMKRSVDVLSLSATPIPRTLHMSMIGVRDMSVIEMPPAERYPVQTYVMEYGDAMVREAILKEAGRGGQVYFVYNRVRNMERFAQYLSALVPEVRIAYAHGQMNERALEKTMLDFMAQQYDVLLCSTIIESGLDIQNVNTIIVYDADKMGLSQLYQLRGRVGRSARLGYAYFTFMRDKVLTEVAEKRLVAIREFTQFGAGFRIAMRDLEIRGAGNLLGPEQHGHMAAVGYDLYCKIMDGAVREARGEKEKRAIETVIDAPISAGIPHAYIPREADRLSMYKRIALIDSLAELYDVQDELIDRFGDIPESVKNLLDIALLKADASRSYITRVSLGDGLIRLVFDPEAPLDVTKLYDATNRIGGAQIIGKQEAPSIVIRREKADIGAIMAMTPQFVYMLNDCVIRQA